MNNKQSKEHLTAKSVEDRPRKAYAYLQLSLDPSFDLEEQTKL